jgi:hypothetical protein
LLILIANPSNFGYMFNFQSDGNLVNYCYDGAYHQINASGGGIDDVQGPLLWDAYIPISQTTLHGISLAAQYWTTQHPAYAWPTYNTHTGADMTGALTIAIYIDTITNVNRIDYEIL